MKRIFLSIIVLLASCLAFSEEFSLFPWFCTDKEIYTYCNNKGWSYHSDAADNVPSFTFNTPDSVTYRDMPITGIHFMFDRSGKVVAQTITFKNMFEAALSFPKVLDLAIADKARLLEENIESEEFINITIDANINDTVKSKYVIYGINNAFQISVVYYTY